MDDEKLIFGEKLLLKAETKICENRVKKFRNLLRRNINNLQKFSPTKTEKQHEKFLMQIFIFHYHLIIKHFSEEFGPHEIAFSSALMLNRENALESSSEISPHPTNPRRRAQKGFLIIWNRSLCQKKVLSYISYCFLCFQFFISLRVLIQK